MAVLGTRIPVHQIIAIIAVTALTALGAIWSAASGPAAAQPETATGRASAYLSHNASLMGLRPDLSDLRLYDERESLTADHVRYQQTLNAVPVFGATVTVNLPKDGKAQATTLNRYISGAREAAIVAPVAPANAVANAAAGVGAPDAKEMAPAELVYYQTPDKKLTLAWKLTLRTLDPFGDWLVIADAATGRQLARLSLLSYDQGQVFDPNPAVTNGGTAPAPDCDSVGKHVQLSGQYRIRTLQGIDPGQGQLKGQFADLTAPGITDAYKPAGVADEPSHNYIYACSDDRFEEVMSYYHLDKTQRKIQSLGFTGSTGIIDRPIAAHAHYFDGCNAFYSGADRGLHFGDADSFLDCFFGLLPSTDFAEDADVIVHEYGHAIQDDQVPGWGLDMPQLVEQAHAMGEGFGDFMAGVINGDPCIGEYVNGGLTACAGAPGLRYMQNSLTYPGDFEACRIDTDGDTVPDTVEEHCAGEIWGGALWDLVEAFSGGAVTQEGRDLALKLVLESQFFLDQEATFNDGAAAICVADTMLYGGAHASVIGSTFAARGISSGACTNTDFPSFYGRIFHEAWVDLDVDFLVGPNPNAPVCQFALIEPDVNPGSGMAYGFDILNAARCADYLNPSVDQPWWLRARDVHPLDVGYIEDFEILLPGGERCVATDTPVNIPDNGPPVYSKVDCTNTVGPGGSTPTPGTGTPTPTPTPTPPPGSGLVGDVDCANGVNSVDALKVLRFVANLSVSQTGECDPINTGGPPVQGDVDCQSGVNSVDALKVLRHVANLNVSQNEPCPDIGTGGGSTPTPTPESGTPTPTFNPSLKECPSFGTEIPVPDNSPNGITANIPVTDYGSLVDLDVCVNVNHPRPSDLRITLKRTSDNVSVVLFDGTSCGLPNFHVYFDDEAGDATICPHDGTEQPANPLAQFDGVDVHGTWKLTFADVAAGQTGKALGTIIHYTYIPN